MLPSRRSLVVSALSVLTVLGAASASAQGTITGRVTNATSGAPVADVSVEFYTSDGDWAGYTYTDATGLYASPGLTAGSYYVRAYAHNSGLISELYNDVPCADGFCDFDAGTTIAVTSGAATAIDFALTPGGRISGTVTNASTGAPVEYVEVDFYTSAGGWSGWTETDENGVYTSNGLPTGSYFVRTHTMYSSVPSLMNELYNDIPCALGCNVMTGTAVPVTAPDTMANINFSLTPGGQISGMITSATTGEPLRSTSIYIYTDSGSYVASTYTNASGIYTSPGLPSGSYVVEAYSGSRPFIGELYGNVLCPEYTWCDVTQGTPVAVTLPNVTPNIDLALTPRVPGDYDRDGYKDLVVFRPSTGTWYIKQSTGTIRTVRWGTAGDVPVPADYDGDDRADVAVFRPSTGTWYIMQSTGTSRTVRWGTTGDIPVPADYDGDGRADPTVFRPSNGTWYELRSSAGSYAVRWGTAGDVPVAGDFDRDHRADPTVFRPSTGTWYQLRSNWSLSTPTTYALRYGTAEDVPLPADYDGDGYADPAVFRPSIGKWYELRSSTGTSYSTYWGTLGDRPIASDYDGDGLIDVTVFRASKGMWYELCTRGGIHTEVVNWGTAGDVPR